MVKIWIPEVRSSSAGRGRRTCQPPRNEQENRMMPHQKKIQHLNPIRGTTKPVLQACAPRTAVSLEWFPLSATISWNTWVMVVVWQFFCRAAVLHRKVKMCYVISSVTQNDLDRALLLFVQWYFYTYWWIFETCLGFGWLFIFKSHAATANFVVRCRHTVCLQWIYDVCIWSIHLKAVYSYWKGWSWDEGSFQDFCGSLGFHFIFQNGFIFQNTWAAGGFTRSCLTGISGHVSFQRVAVLQKLHM